MFSFYSYLLTLDLLNAVKVWNRDNILSFLSHSVYDINKPLDEQKTTLLHEAAKWNDVTICEVLLKKAANVNVRNSFGETPLHIVATQQINEIAEIRTQLRLAKMLHLMLHYDADIHIKNNNDESVKDIYMGHKDDYLKEVILINESNTFSKCFT